ncbi:MAG: histidine phosphatase family protein [Chitinophagaceae bacterium]|nr:histidine phosphatase family protein [Chitinophagaceae bacterium]
MSRFILLISTLIFYACNNTFYIVRHAEKETASTMITDVPLSKAGEQRAYSLKDALKNKHIRYIFSTNTLRTTSTVKLLSNTIGVKIHLYEAPDASFINQLKEIKRGNVLIVGHSNTVDDIVNGLTGKKILNDLADDEYGDLFIVKRQGKSYTFTKSHFGMEAH